MSSSSAPPPGRPPRRATPGSNGPTPSKEQPSMDSTWPLPRNAAPSTEAAPPTGKRARKQEPKVPPAPGAAQLPRTGAQAATASEKGSTRPNARGRAPEGTEDRIPILPPTPLDTSRQAKNTTKAQPQQAGPGSPFPTPPAPRSNQGLASLQDKPVPPRPLRTVPSGPVPPPLNPNRAAVPPQPPVPESLQDSLLTSATARSGPSLQPPSRAGQPSADVFPPGMSRQGRGPSSIPEQPGPAPSFPVPTPSKSPKRMNAPAGTLRSDQARPPPLRVGNTVPSTQQQGSAAFTEPVADQKGLPSKATPGGPIARKPVNQTPLVSSPPRPGQLDMPPGAFPPSMNPLRSSPPNPPQQQGNPGCANPLRSSPPNPQLQSRNPPDANFLRSSPPNPLPQPGSQAGRRPSIYRPSTVSPPPRTENMANFAPPSVTSPPRQMPPSGPPRVTSPPGFSGARPGATYPGPQHAHSSSLDSNVSNDSMTSSATATSTRPLNPVQRQNTGFAKPTRQNTDIREKGVPGGGGYYPGETGSAQTPYMNMLLSLDRIPRLHNILVSLFVWILLAGFIISTGSFTSTKRKEDGQTVEIGLPTKPNADKLALTPANTAAMVVGFACIIAGTFGSAWLALRWRRNYVWLLNKLYLPLVLDALAGLLATLVSVYAQQAGEWSTQAVITGVIEGAILGVNVVFFFVYNYWLLQRLRSEHEGVVGGGKEERKGERKKRKGRKKGGWFARFRRVRKKPPIAAGSIV